VTPRELEEYRALRQTIRERGTVRIWLVLAAMTAWGGLAISTTVWAPWPVATLLPLLVLASGFEAVFALHTGVERLGRYLQVFYEDDESARKWEHQAMAYGKRFPGGSDPLFALFFYLATLFNFVPVVLTGALPIEYGAVGSLHLLFLIRRIQARRQAARQRSIELERFLQLKQSN
jgi:hypothetical protein